MKNAKLYQRACAAAYEVGERVRIANNRPVWTEEEIDAAATELRRRLLDEDRDPVADARSG